MEPVGGQVQGISLDSFLQMVQMEKTTCTLKVLDNENVGFLYVVSGDLVAAEVGALSGIDAAHEIISWDNSVIEIENSCDKETNEINQPLMNILMEGLRLRDEKRESGQLAPAAPEPPPEAPAAPPIPGIPSVDESGTPIADRPAAQPAAPLQQETPEAHRPAEVAAAPVAKKRAGKKGPSKLILLVLLLIVAGGAGAYFFLSGSSFERQYEILQEQLTQTTSEDDKINLIEKFLDTEPTGDVAEEAAIQLEALKSRRDTKIYAAVSGKASRLAESGHFDAAVQALEEFLEGYPESVKAPAAQSQLKRLRIRMADAEFAILKQLQKSGKPENIEEFDTFLTKYPKSTHAATVREWIDGLSDAYYGYMDTQMAEATKEEDWQRCIDLTSRFIRLYPEHQKTSVVQKLQPVLKRRMQEKADYDRIMKAAAAKGTDYQAASEVLRSYLNAYPDTYKRKLIEDQAKRYRRLSDSSRISALREKMAVSLSSASSRFVVHENGTFTDRNTGLMWSLVDSEGELGDCTDFVDAKAYIAALKTGDFNDWRFPTPVELLSLYDSTPRFPSPDGAWYWSSHFHRRYVGKWVEQVTSVQMTASGPARTVQKDARECGAVRAVRN